MASALDFPDQMPSGVQVQVPRPCENHTQWTKDSYLARIPPMLDDFIGQLPDHNFEPVVYATAVDTMRMTNHYFQEKFGKGESLVDVVTEDVTEEAMAARQAKVLRKSTAWKRNPERKGLDPIYVYADPLDFGTLSVKHDLDKPKKILDLWDEACQDLDTMPDELWEKYLSKTRKQLIDQAKGRKGELRTESYLISEIFKRYLVWRELSLKVSRRSRLIMERQPTWNELEEFFSNEDVKKNGATFVETCHAFPHARNY